MVTCNSARAIEETIFCSHSQSELPPFGLAFAEESSLSLRSHSLRFRVNWDSLRPHSARTVSCTPLQKPFHRLTFFEST